MAKDNTQSNPFGKIQIILEKLCYRPGEQVNGYIYLHLNQEYPNNFVNLNFIGEEFVRFEKQVRRTRRTRDGSRTEYRTETFTDDQVILEYNYTVHQFQTPRAPPGTYCFPISFTVPINVPASFFCKTNTGYRKTGSIEYRLSAILPTPNPKEIPSVACEEAVIISNPDFPTAPVNGTVVKKGSCYCCFDKGFFKISAMIEKSSFKIGEESAIMFQIDDSQGKAPVRSVQVIIQQKMDLATYSQVCPSEHILLYKEELFGVSSEKMREGMRVPFKIPQIALQNGGFVYPSLHSRLVRNSFSVSVVLNLDIKGCCKVNPTASFEINVASDSSHLRQQDLEIIDILKNEIHHPQIMQNYVLDFSDQYAKTQVGNYNANQFAGGMNQNGMNNPGMPIGDGYQAM